MFYMFANSVPEFILDTELAPEAAVCGTEWLYQLPPVNDDDELDVVEIEINSGAAAYFL